MEQRFSLGSYGTHLWTREKAKTIREEVEKTLGGLDRGDVLVLDTEGVEVFDYSFANEFFGRIVLSLPHEYPGRFVIVDNLTKYTEENLAKALEGMGVAMIKRKGKSLHLIGKVHPSDEVTFSEIEKSGDALTASQLAEKLRVNLNAVNERLTKLTSLGVVRREKAVSPAGRELYVYRVLA
jgi:hypothetical protein